jgi:hypothetical protein
MADHEDELVDYDEDEVRYSKDYQSKLGWGINSNLTVVSGITICDYRSKLPKSPKDHRQLVKKIDPVRGVRKDTM